MHALGKPDGVARAVDDDAAIQVGLVHRLDDLGLRRAVHDPVEGLALQHGLELVLVGDTREPERGTRSEVAAITGG